MRKFTARRLTIFIGLLLVLGLSLSACTAPGRGVQARVPGVSSHPRPATAATRAAGTAPAAGDAPSASALPKTGPPPR